MPATFLNLPLKCLIASSDPITASHSLSVERKHIIRIRHHFLDAVLGGAVPHHEKRLLLFGHGRDAEADAGRDQAMNGLDFFLQDQAAKPLDRVLGVGFFLDHKFELAAGDAAILVHPFGCPLHGANSAFAGGTGDARSRRDNSDLERLVLRNGGRENVRRGSGEQRRRLRVWKNRDASASLEIPPVDRRASAVRGCHTINISATSHQALFSGKGLFMPA